MNKELAVTIGQGTRRARCRRRLTQEQVADSIGLSTEFYARVERGHAMPSVPTLAKICERLGVSADVLINGDPHDRIQQQTYEAPESADVRRLIRQLRRLEPMAMRAIVHFIAAISAVEKSRSMHSKRREPA